MDGHKIPPPEELKNNKYYKWQNSFNHATSNCIVIRKAIQRAIKEGRFKLADKGIAEMTVYSDPFPVMEKNMVSLSGLHESEQRGKGK